MSKQTTIDLPYAHATRSEAIFRFFFYQEKSSADKINMIKQCRNGIADALSASLAEVSKASQRKENVIVDCFRFSSLQFSTRFCFFGDFITYITRFNVKIVYKLSNKNLQLTIENQRSMS